MTMKPIIIIPARYASSRLPAKPLLEIAGKPLIQHVYERALQASGFAATLIATDHEAIYQAAKHFGAQVCMTANTHLTGSDRLAEVVQQYAWDDQQIIVNLQGDEPLTPVANLQQLARNLSYFPEAAIATLATPIEQEADFHNPNIVKVVRDQQGMALYFSRASIPFQRDGKAVDLNHYALRHIGMYAYRAKFLKQFSQLAPSPLEQLEMLEQLRAMHYGYAIHVDIAHTIPETGVDTPEDVERITQLITTMQCNEQ